MRDRLARILLAFDVVAHLLESAQVRIAQRCTSGYAQPQQSRHRSSIAARGLIAAVAARHFGGTLAGNALSIAAMRATLEHVLTPEMYARGNKLADRYEAWRDLCAERLL